VSPSVPIRVVFLFIICVRMGAQIGFATILQTAVNIVTELLSDEDEDGDNVIEKN
jgi:hypothetical protein